MGSRSRRWCGSASCPCLRYYMTIPFTAVVRTLKGTDPWKCAEMCEWHHRSSTSRCPPTHSRVDRARSKGPSAPPAIICVVAASQNSLAWITGQTFPGMPGVYSQPAARVTAPSGPSAMSAGRYLAALAARRRPRGRPDNRNERQCLGHEGSGWSRNGSEKTAEGQGPRKGS